MAQICRIADSAELFSATIRANSDSGVFLTALIFLLVLFFASRQRKEQWSCGLCERVTMSQFSIRRLRLLLELTHYVPVQLKVTSSATEGSGLVLSPDVSGPKHREVTGELAVEF